MNIKSQLKEITPKEDLTYYMVLDVLLYSNTETNRQFNEDFLFPILLDEHNFGAWYSCN
ncbi:MAG: hypothetical protein ACERKD_03900 [Prolixibacteraceae bacterium]